MTAANTQGKIHLHVLVPSWLKSKLDALSFESVISNSELVTFAVERLCCEGEADIKDLVVRVAQPRESKIPNRGGRARNLAFSHPLDTPQPFSHLWIRQAMGNALPRTWPAVPGELRCL